MDDKSFVGVFRKVRDDFNSMQDGKGKKYPQVMYDIEDVKPKEHKDTYLRAVAVVLIMLEHNKTRNLTYKPPKGSKLPKELPTTDNLSKYDISDGFDTKSFEEYIRYLMEGTKRGESMNPLNVEAKFKSMFVRYLVQLKTSPIALVEPTQ